MLNFHLHIQMITITLIKDCCKIYKIKLKRYAQRITLRSVRGFSCDIQSWLVCN